jgi:hypothetical protein
MSKLVVNGHTVSGYGESTDGTNELVMEVLTHHMLDILPHKVYFREQDLVAMLRMVRGEVPNTPETYQEAQDGEAILLASYTRKVRLFLREHDPVLAHLAVAYGCPTTVNDVMEEIVLDGGYEDFAKEWIDD